MPKTFCALNPGLTRSTLMKLRIKRPALINKTNESANSEMTSSLRNFSSSPVASEPLPEPAPATVAESSPVSQEEKPAKAVAAG